MKSMTETREMSFEQIIEYLKQNTTIYDLWSEEVKHVADKIERKWWVYYRLVLRSFDICDCENCKLGAFVVGNNVYRLSPDYQPPKQAGKWVKWPVRLLINSRNKLRYIAEDPQGRDDGIHMGDCIGVEGFGGVLYEDCECCQPRPSHAGVFLMTPPNPCEKHGPHKPVKVRFWKEG